jgi:uncharacterized cupredoxin-like copper-binding protein
LKSALISLALLAPLAAAAHGEMAHPTKKPAGISTEQHPWGREGDPKKSVRTIRVDMADTMRFTPDRIEVKRGQTVSFVVRNAGKVMHEFVIGTLPALNEHAELMKKHPGMEHGEPYMAHVEPGRTQRIHWTFTEAGTYHAGCLLPGHWEAGMKATITVKE